MYLENELCISVHIRRRALHVFLPLRLYVSKHINEATLPLSLKGFKHDDDDCFYYHSWRNNVVIAFGTLSSFLT